MNIVGKDGLQNPPQPPKIPVTKEMMKNFKTLTCDCGGMIFENAVVFKKISAIISPSGKEELFPLEVLVCKECGKVPTGIPGTDVLPDEVFAKQQPESSGEN